MLSIFVYSTEGELFHRCDVEDMQDLLRVFRTELQPRFSDESLNIQVSGELYITEPFRGPEHVAPVLPARQQEVLCLLALSHAPKQIATEMGISEPTVRMHINALKKRFGVDNVNQLMAVAGALELCNPFPNTPPWVTGEERELHNPNDGDGPQIPDRPYTDPDQEVSA